MSAQRQIVRLAPLTEVQEMGSEGNTEQDQCIHLHHGGEIVEVLGHED